LVLLPLLGTIASAAPAALHSPSPLSHLPSALHFIASLPAAPMIIRQRLHPHVLIDASLHPLAA
jgi:hypothetical protein